MSLAPLILIDLKDSDPIDLPSIDRGWFMAGVLLVLGRLQEYIVNNFTNTAVCNK